MLHTNFNFLKLFKLFFNTLTLSIFGVKELRNGSRTLPAVLKADSEATDVTGIDKTSRAIIASAW